MPLIYVFTINDPSSEIPIHQLLPPAIVSFLSRIVSLKGIYFGYDGKVTIFMFNDLLELQNFINDIKLTAEQQVTVDDWKLVHGISYTHQIYSLSSTDLISDINWIS